MNFQHALEQALKQEQNDEQQEAAVVAQGLAKAAMLLAGHYQWVITNVPYLARGKQNERLRDFCERIIQRPRMIWPPFFLTAAWSSVWKAVLPALFCHRTGCF